MATQVCVETGTKKVFAVALDWPGWARSGKTEEEALEALRAYADRYAPVVQAAGLAFPASAKTLRVTEHIEGGASTDFGIPHGDKGRFRVSIFKQRGSCHSLATDFLKKGSLSNR